ncbi:TPA: hypothetical protein N0F65_009040 [Lagenidium giganteum]|uniref:ACB domain-containing protein n=1 Tax=Lagenidium giganteum TaxID=4803 RepID=A0AAV2YS49_9STRA|nr:TPA: hypothetical protein N0F65_009040 [Lagenidium giganteum]
MRGNAPSILGSSRLLSPSFALPDEDTDAQAAAASPQPLAITSPRGGPAVAGSSGGHSGRSHSCDSCTELETEFAAAVLFVESYQGPHRILTQENSTPKKEFYAYCQQATIGPCPATPPPGAMTKLELAKWEKWRSLGQMTRQEAMKRYTTALDNLVDDWRRSASIKGTSMFLNLNSSTSSASTASPQGSVCVANLLLAQALKKSTSMFERLPKIYDEFGELQERLEEEVKKRDELEAHLLSFTRENRALFSREMRQVDQMRTHLASLVKTLEDDVAHHYNELQQVMQQQQELVTRLESSVLLAIELRGHQVFRIVREWFQNKMFRRLLFCVLLFRLWSFFRRRGLPQVVAQMMIKWLRIASSLDSNDSNRPALSN